MMRRLSGRERRTVVVGALFVMGVTALRGAPAWLEWQRSMRESAHEVLAEAARAEEQVRELNESVGTLTRSRMLAEMVRLRLLDDGAAGGAGAASTLTSLVSKAAGASGVAVTSMRVAAVDTSADLQRIGVMLDAAGDIHGLARLLLAFDTAQSLLVVRELSVTQPAPADPDTNPERLQLRLRVEGLALNPHVRDDS